MPCMGGVGIGGGVLVYIARPSVFVLTQNVHTPSPSMYIPSVTHPSVGGANCDVLLIL